MISQKRGGTRTTGQPARTLLSHTSKQLLRINIRARRILVIMEYIMVTRRRERERESLLIVVAVRELALSVAPKLARAKESIHTYSLFLSSLHEPDDLVSYHPRDRLARRNAH